MESQWRSFSIKKWSRIQTNGENGNFACGQSKERGWGRKSVGTKINYFQFIKVILIILCTMATATTVGRVGVGANARFCTVYSCNNENTKRTQSPILSVPNLFCCVETRSFVAAFFLFCIPMWETQVFVSLLIYYFLPYGPCSVFTAPDQITHTHILSRPNGVCTRECLFPLGFVPFCRTFRIQKGMKVALVAIN